MPKLDRDRASMSGWLATTRTRFQRGSESRPALAACANEMCSRYDTGWRVAPTKLAEDAVCRNHDSKIQGATAGIEGRTAASRPLPLHEFYFL